MGRLATDPAKRELFKKLARNLRGLAGDIAATIGKRA